MAKTMSTGRERPIAAAEDGAGGEDPEQVDRQDIQRPGGAHRHRLPPQTKGKLFSNIGVKKLYFSHLNGVKKVRSVT
jgi:hypothetical protein